MFCTKCSAPLTAGMTFCPRCGRPVAENPGYPVSPAPYAPAVPAVPAVPAAPVPAVINVQVTNPEEKEKLCGCSKGVHFVVCVVTGFFWFPCCCAAFVCGYD
eukprot:EG_transcript_16766